MRSQMNEDLAWLRVQDVQREAENRRLLAGSRTKGTALALRRLVRAVAKLRPGAATPPARRSTGATQPHA